MPGRGRGDRSARLLDAQAKAAELFAAIEPRGIIAPGVREIEASDAVRNLAAEMFGVSRNWHKRIVRAGPNTLEPYKQNPPDLTTADDIVFLDFGPIFEQWEANFGRTYVLGDDPVKLRLRNALPVMFRAGRQFFEAHEDVTGEQLYAHMTGLADADGWTFGGTIAGHLVGQFPHDKLPAMTSSPTSRRAATSRCAGRTGAARSATGSSRSTWSTSTGRSAGSSRNCSTSARALARFRSSPRWRRGSR